ncbi:hypothetical protein [Paraburkholderia atlantica]|uniref:hypothetical protein n=1 Tax=Paraburkholderia atlantica TaxID=2654982 RepID=UPI00160A4D75|nr:hypothetical protein [Paraburkholderia atlantica]MBB5508132.1 hypothetical protein [Paraburkholderia atlantica]
MTTTEWFPAVIAPVHVGWYEIQDRSLRCTCCCMDAYWNGVDFVRSGYFGGRLGVYEVFRNVTRWRGLTEKAA